MADPRFDELREALLEAGVAERKVRRAVMEIESHFQQLISTLASLLNVGVKFTGGPNAVEVGAGMGLSPESLPGQLTRAVVLASLAWSRCGSRFGASHATTT